MSYPGIINYRVPVRGSSVVAFLGLYSRTGEWVYSLWTDDDEVVVATGSLGVVAMDITPDQAARIAFPLEVDYGGTPMMVITELRKATRNIGTRVVAMTEDGHRWVELFDWNKSQDANHLEAAAQLVNHDPQLVAAGAVLRFETSTETVNVYQLVKGRK